MKNSMFMFCSIALLISACSGSPTPKNPSSVVDENSPALATDYSVVDPKKVAQYLANAGFTTEDALRVKGNAFYIDRVQKIELQSTDIVKDKSEIVLESMELILNGVTKESNISSQAVSRSLIVNAANNISLNSLSNFQYYQSQRYLDSSTPYRLNYVDDGCSAPSIAFVPNNVFYEACDQHDFGYRNGLYYELHNASFKQAVDIRFYNNMILLCDRYQIGYLVNVSCKTDAAVFYTGVVAPIVTASWLAAPSK